jgi:hypothetical protein
MYHYFLRGLHEIPSMLTYSFLLVYPLARSQRAVIGLICTVLLHQLCVVASLVCIQLDCPKVQEVFVRLVM